MLDSQGKMYIEDNDIIELMLANRQVKILPTNRKSFETFELECRQFGLPVPFVLAEDTNNIQWNMPAEYQALDIEEYITNNHQLNTQQLARVQSELEEFEQRDLVDLLRFLVYFVKLLRSNNVVYGVGRGSSIASYVLYLIGIHRIDSFKYNLDIKEFLK
jgi:DNA polymerase III alpha subunit